MGKREKKKLGAIFISIFAVFVVLCLLLTASSYNLLPFKFPSWESAFGKAETEVENITGDKSKVHFVDCWQGDCEVIVSQGEVTVIDSGPGKTKDKTLEYIKNLGIKKIDFLVLTHAHEDHIGGAQKLVENFEIGKIYMGKPTASTTPNTVVYRNLLKAIKSKNLKITAAKAGDEFNCGKFKMTFLSPGKDYDDLNNQSAVIHAVYDDVSFLFAGDAEKEANADMMKNYPNELKSTVLKAGHHGSKTSTTDKWLKAVSPTYAVISCGEGNTYGHPHGVVLSRLEKANVKIYRTDLSGSIVMTTNGQSISANIEKAAG